MIKIQREADLRRTEPNPLGHLIIVDDNPGDITLFRAAASEVGLHAQIHVAEDAAQFFTLMRLFLDPPALVILDLNLPLLKGDFILAEIRDDRVWQEVPVVVLTSSQATRDMLQCRHLGATDFMTKPALFDGYIELARGLAQYLKPAGSMACGGSRSAPEAP